MNNLHKLVVLTISCLVLISQQASAQGNTADLVAQSLAHPQRPAEDAADDARRMPLEVLAFAGIEPGMTVLELEAGSGYYTEILSRVVGPDGAVIMHNPPAFESFAGEAIRQRTAGSRLSNVEVSRTNFDTLDVPDASVDMVTWILGPHELWWEPSENVSLGDPVGSFAEIARVLKPGGKLLAIDHIAPPGSSTDVGGTLHRIGENHITALAERAGLSMLRSSNLHKNENDPLDIGVFDPQIQGRTSKFVLVFEK